MQFTAANLVKELEAHMKKTEDALKVTLNSIRTGKASPSLVDGITVEYYGTATRLRDLANITTPEPRMLMIQPWDKSALALVEKAIIAANIGITPMNDGSTIRLPIPELSEERRQQLSKQAKSYTEDAKVALRNIRRDGNEAAKKFKNDSEYTEDELKRKLDEIQKLTDRSITGLDTVLAAKEKELMTV